jgi:hypothetical protein
MEIPDIDLSGQERIFVFLSVLVSTSYLLLQGDLTAIIFRDLILGSLGAVLADSAHDRHVRGK